MILINKQLQRRAYRCSGAELEHTHIPDGGIVYHHSFKDEELYDYLPDHLSLGFTNTGYTYLSAIAEIEGLSDLWLLNYLKGYGKYN